LVTTFFIVAGFCIQVWAGSKKALRAVAPARRGGIKIRQFRLDNLDN
jgi:hypothetical protein